MKPRLWLCVVALALSGCSLPFVGNSPTPSPTSSPRPRSTATIAIAEPPPNTVVTSTTLHVAFTLTGGRIVNVTTKNITPDTGHIHLSIDGRLISMNYQLAQDVSLQAFAPGAHSLQGEFVAADHLPFSPRVIARIIIEYQPPGSG
ncbi:MAG TPA: hypothetical protein VIT43_14590 [Candidatus Dormibacteraeota bacterium]